MKLVDIKHKIGADTLSKKGEVYTARKQFFYRHGRTAENFAERIAKEFPNAMIDSFSEEWHPFRGGANVANSSHWWVKFTLENEIT